MAVSASDFDRSETERRVEQLRPVSVKLESKGAAQFDVLYGMWRDVRQQIGPVELEIVTFDNLVT